VTPVIVTDETASGIRNPLKTTGKRGGGHQLHQGTPIRFENVPHRAALLQRKVGDDQTRRPRARHGAAEPVTGGDVVFHLLDAGHELGLGHGRRRKLMASRTVADLDRATEDADLFLAESLSLGVGT
jgi:hypothetical protein